jgi:NADH-quinone oxidoreductase subunit A
MIPWPLLLHFALAMLLVASIIGASHLLGERRSDPAGSLPYESGIAPTGTARRPLPIQFYLVGIAFVIFDLEVAYLVAWAIAIRDVGWAGFAVIGVFVAVLLVGLLYEWRQGVLDWGGALTADRLRAAGRADDPQRATAGRATRDLRGAAGAKGDTA